MRGLRNTNVVHHHKNNDAIIPNYNKEWIKMSKSEMSVVVLRALNLTLAWCSGRVMLFHWRQQLHLVDTSDLMLMLYNNDRSQTTIMELTFNILLNIKIVRKEQVLPRQLKHLTFLMPTVQNFGNRKLGVASSHVECFIIVLATRC